MLNVKLGRYRATWFDHIDWSEREVELIATSEQQVRQYVDTLRLPEYRYKPYRKDKEDSLTIDFDGDVVIPYVL